MVTEYKFIVISLGIVKINNRKYEWEGKKGSEDRGRGY